MILVEGARWISDRRSCGTTPIITHAGITPEHKLHGAFAFVPMQSECPTLAMVIAHELGHAFGLMHSPTQNTLMYPTSDHAGRALTALECEWLDGTRYFNHDHSDIRDVVGVHPLKSEAKHEDGEHSVDLHFRITTHEGARMLMLYRQPGYEVLTMEPLRA